MKGANEIKVGIMVCISLGVLVALTLKAGNFNLSPDKGYTITVQFHDVDGVNLNSPVMYNGFEIGTVEKIRINDSQDQALVEVDLWVRKEIRLRKGTKAYVKNLGFMGEKYVGLKSSGAASEYITAGDMIIGEDPVDFTALVEKGKTIAENVDGITTSLKDRLVKNEQTIDDLLTNAKGTMEGMSSLVANVNTRLAANEERIDSIVGNLESVSVNLEDMSADLKQNPWKLLYRPKGVREAKE